MRQGNTVAQFEAALAGAKAAGAKGGMTTGLMLAGTVGLLALPSAVLAFSAGIRGDAEPVARASGALASLNASPAGGGLSGAQAMRSLAKGRLYLFTPAKNPNRPDRSITVAVRIDPLTVKGISVRGNKMAQMADGGASQVRIAPTAFNLGVSRGYRNFSQELAHGGSGRSELPDLAPFSIAPGKGGDSRFSPRIVMDERPTAGRAPGTFSGDREDRVDVGGSYRVTRNLDVTAGVRYSQERERLMPLTDGKQDSQAVYVGTQFRF